MDNFIFIKRHDIIGNDLYHTITNDINILINKALNDNNCVGFNTLGFLKNKIDEINSSPYFNENDGIYIKKEYYKEYLLNKKTINIKLICNWCSSQQLCEEFKYMCNDIQNYQWNNLKICSNDKDIDYYVIINRPYNENILYIPEKTIIFQMEPWVYNEKFNWGVKNWGKWSIPNENIFLKVFGRKTNDYNNVFWQLELDSSQLENLKYEQKKDELSTICSSKYFDEGHIKRIDFLKFLENKNDIPLNIFNSDNNHNFINYKGPKTPYIDKSTGIIPYKYYFMVENNYEKDFITEKLWEPILCESLCFYYGCPNVYDYVSNECFILLDMNDFEYSYNIIKKAIEEDWWSQRINAIKKQKEILLNEMQFFPRIEKIIKKDIIINFLKNQYEASAWKGHLDFAYNLVKQINPNIVVDLGVDFGHSTFSYSGSCNGTIYGIDWFEGDEHAGKRKTYDIVKDTYKFLLEKNILEKNNIIFVKGDFNEIAKVFDKKIDLLHIDGLHTYEAVKNDFETWFPKLNDNGLILMHDICSFPESVGKFFNEIQLPKFKFYHSAGLGVISKNETIINKLQKKNIIFIHSCTLEKSGITKLIYLLDYIILNNTFYELIDEIYIINIGNEISLNDKYKNSKIKLCNYSSNTQLYEIPTLNQIKYFADNNENSNHRILYLHTKGISYSNNYQQINDWINCMLYFLIDKYQICFDYLDQNYDAVGINFLKKPFNHFSGNFWWSSSKYLRTLPSFDEINVDKMSAEWWLCKNNLKCCSLHNSNINHFFETYPKEKYAF